FILGHRSVNPSGLLLFADFIHPHSSVFRIESQMNQKDGNTDEPTLTTGKPPGVDQDITPELDLTIDRGWELGTHFWESGQIDELSNLAPAEFDHRDDLLDVVVGRRFSSYRCDALLGRGGMARVYLAHHFQLGRPCALKISSPQIHMQDSPLWRSTFREGRTTATLIHPHIVTVHAVGESRGRSYLEMELVSGGSLKHKLRKEGPLPLIKALEWTTAASHGLEFAHRHGILHRDIKPDNILICSRGTAKLADFGLAHHHLHTSRFPEGQVVGTVPYLAPEIIRNGEVTPAADVYALGVTLYQLLTGRLPFGGQSFDELTQNILTETPPDLRTLRPDLPLNVVSTVEELMSHDLGSRPADGTAAWHLLSAVLGQLRDVESILHDALGHDPAISWIRCGDKYRLNVQLPDGRQQNVFVESSSHRPDQQLLMIYSICCPAVTGYYETALRINSDLSHGGLAIRDIEGTPHFVMVDTYPRGTVDPEEVRKSVRQAAQTADDVEKRLTNLDRN
ncbi:MAG: serine/threonine protein kinase, partial [Planctomycetaceae bacterium]|nr:serine/threonine protein kinase [Planctomycetaceae bacterium]